MYLALRELGHAKLRFTMIGVIIMLIAWLVFILSGLANGLSTDNGSSVTNMNADYLSFQDESRLYMHRSLLPMEKVSQIQDQKNVKDATPIGHYTVTVMKKGSKTKIDSTILAIDPDGFLSPKTLEGKSLKQAKKNEIVIDKKFKQEGIKVGDTLKVESTTKELKVIGFTQKNSYNHLPVIFMDIPSWQEIRFAAPGSDRGLKNPISAIAIQGNNLSSKSLDNRVGGIESVTKSEALQSLPGYKEENGTITMMLVFLFFIAAFVLAVFFYVITMQKTNQFGVMKAIGANSGFLAKMIISQVFVLSLISILVGIALTYITAALIPNMVPFALDTKLVLIYSGILLVVSLLSSLVSVRRIIKIDALQALGRAE